MQVNFHKYKSAAPWSRLLSRKQITHSHLLSGLMEQELNTLGFQPFSDSQGPDSCQECLLSTSQGHTEVFPWCQPGPALWPRWHPALQTAGFLLAFRELWQGKELASIKPTSANLTWQHLLSNQTSTELTLTSSHRARHFVPANIQSCIYGSPQQVNECVWSVPFCIHW